MKIISKPQILLLVNGSIGVGFPGEPPRYLHSPEFDIDEGALLIGARILAQLAIQLSKS